MQRYLKLQKFLTNHFVRDNYIEEFINFNKNTSKLSGKNYSTALFETGVYYPIYIVNYYLTNIMHSKNIRCVGFFADNSLSQPSRLINWIFSKTKVGNGRNYPQRIYASMGINKFLIAPKAKISKLDKENIEILIRQATPQSILEARWHDILIGDLFYDWHLRRTGKATLDFEDFRLKKDFLYFISNLNWWMRKFEKESINFVFISHAVYVQGLIGRIGIKYNAKVFVVGDERFNQLSNERLHQDSEFKFYHPDSSEQFGYKINLIRANEQINRLILGSQEVDDAHKTVSGYIGTEKIRIVKKSKPVRILIAAHCFSDAAHLTGVSVFSDYKIWLNYLSSFAAKHAEYEWYVKEHPGFYESDKVIFEEFCQDNPHLTRISSQYSNPELFAQGINVVLSVNGPISFEAALNNILVVNCSKITPHMNYKFAKHAETLRDYEDYLQRMPELIEENSINEKEIYHFYDLHHLRRNHSWLYRNYRQEMLLASGGYGPHLTDSRVFHYWLHNFLPKVNLEVSLSEINRYIMSENYLISFEEFHVSK